MADSPVDGLSAITDAARRLRDASAREDNIDEEVQEVVDAANAYDDVLDRYAKALGGR